MSHRRLRRPATLAALLAALLTCGATALAATPRYEVSDLGNFFATGVNDSGWVSGFDGRALLWRPGQGLSDLGAFGTTVGATSNRANAVNNAGQVAGFAYAPALGAYRAFVWQQGTGLVDQGDLPDGGNSSRAEAINTHGASAGQASGQYQGHSTYGFLSFGHAAVFGPSGTVVDLEAHPEGTLNSIVRGLNDAGQAVGERQTSAGSRAIYWDANGTALDLGALWGVAGPSAPSFAKDINNQGQVALQLPLASGGSTAALWQTGVGFTEIARLPGASSAVANAINDAGQAVGSAGTFGVAGTRAFLWTAGDGLQDLNDWLDPVLGAGWLILDANAISEQGLIAGRGWHPSLGYRAILLSPVAEPSAVLLMSGGILGLLLWRRRRGRPLPSA